MRLRITTPLSVVVDEDAVQIVSAEDSSGGFGLAVGVVSWKDHIGARRYCAVHGGVLTVTGGQEVAITTREAIPGDDLATLDEAILDRFGADAEAERARRVDSTKLQLRAIREIVRHLRPGALS
jgi:F-type H+-transporting ATPase subunit epsilon